MTKVKPITKHNASNKTIALQTGSSEVQMSFDEAVELKQELTKEIFKLSHQLGKSEYIKISLEDLKQSLEGYTLEWEDVVGFDFCVERMERLYPETNHTASLLIERDTPYEYMVTGYQYAGDHELLVDIGDIEDNFSLEQVWGSDRLSLNEVKACMSDDLIQFVIDNPYFGLKWDGEHITPRDLIENGETKFFSFSSNYDT